MFNMENQLEITEEYFGILTDDGLALDATLMGPAGVQDTEIKSIKVWVPKYPLTRSSVITAARRALSVWQSNSVASLVFDHRGTGESEGLPDAEGLPVDLHSIQEWARERFGPGAEVEFLGFPEMGSAAGLLTLPIRAGVIAEFYRYDPPGKRKGVILYFSHYFAFDREDDQLAFELANGGYTVYGGDLMRYLLLAAPQSPEGLAQDTASMIEPLGTPLYIVARALAAGPALMMASLVPEVGGIIVTGPAQEGLGSGYIFDNHNPANFLISRAIKKMSSRPAIFLWNRSEAGVHSPDELKNIYNQAEKPKLWGAISQLSASVLLNALNWLVQNS